MDVSGIDMKYLDSFRFAKPETEELFLHDIERSCYDTFYPFMIFPPKGFRQIDFEDITILYGSNGSGKSTALNLIANKIEAERDTVYNRSNFFEDYLGFCEVRFEDEAYEEKVILTSDGVFDTMLDIRHMNQHIDMDREEAFEEYVHWKAIATEDSFGRRFSAEQKREFEEIRRHPLANLEKFKRSSMARNKNQTQSKFVRKYVADNVREMSNGESAFEYFIHRIDKGGIYILDEPENSLSTKLQLELVKYIQDSARFRYHYL